MHVNFYFGQKRMREKNKSLQRCCKYGIVEHATQSQTSPVCDGPAANNHLRALCVPCAQVVTRPIVTTPSIGTNLPRWERSACFRALFGTDRLTAFLLNDWSSVKPLRFWLQGEIQLVQ